MKAILIEEIERHKFPKISDKDDNVRRFQTAWNQSLDSLVRNAETIDAEPQPHSRWVKFGGAGSDYSDRWQCERCKQTARAESWGKVCEYERCPHCGAIMDAMPTVDLLETAKEDIRKLLCSEYGDVCQFCKHGNNENAQCAKIGGHGSWCSEHAAWRYADGGAENGDC